MKTKKIVLSCFILMFIFHSISSQGLEIGIGGGGVMYWGDLTPADPIENLGNMRLGGSFYLRSDLTDKFSARINLLIGKLAGADSLSSNQSMSERNLSFTSLISELSLQGEYHPVSFDLGDRENAIRFYITAGVSVFKYRPRAVYQDRNYDLQPLGTEGQGLPGYADKYGLTGLAFPLGAGIKIRITERISINPEFNVKMTFTDYLDDVSGASYVNYNELRIGNGEIAAALGNREAEGAGLSEPLIFESGTRQRGGQANDLYFTGMLHFTYKFNDEFAIIKRKSKFDMGCPTF